MEFLIEIIHRDRFLIEDGYHNRDSIIVVLGGSYCCQIGGKEEVFRKNDICIFHKEDHFIRTIIEPLRCLYLQFEHFPIDLPAGRFCANDTERVESTITYLERAAAAGEQGLAEHYLWDIFYQLQHHFGDRKQPDATVTACIAYMRQNYPQKIALDDLAKLFSISRQGLMRKFKEQTGQTVFSYLSQIRMEHSKQMLRDTDEPIGTIAIACGFENVYYFSNSFKKYNAITPLKYRKRINL